MITNIVVLSLFDASIYGFEQRLTGKLHHTVVSFCWFTLSKALAKAFSSLMRVCHKHQRCYSLAYFQRAKLFPPKRARAARENDSPFSAGTENVENKTMIREAKFLEWLNSCCLLPIAVIHTVFPSRTVCRRATNGTYNESSASTHHVEGKKAFQEQFLSGSEWCVFHIRLG